MLIVGGGIAGIAAAVRLAERGVAVTLLETRKKLGGRATSFTDPRTGEVLDNCQHVVLGCCTNYMDLLRRLGAEGMIRWTREQYWVEEDGRTSVIRPGVLPAPLHFSGSMLRAKFLTKGEVAAIGRASMAILRANRRGHAAETFGAFLSRHRQPERAVRRFWSPIVVSACNLDVDRVAASSALHVFQEGFLASARAGDIGVAGVPLVVLYERAYEVIAGGKSTQHAAHSTQVETPGRVVLGAGVARLDRTSATTTDGERYEAERVICALPVERVNSVVAPEVRAGDARFDRLDGFTHSPILGVHMTFDAPVLETPHAVLVDRPTQWLFRKDERGAKVHAVISAADAWMELSEEQIAQRVLADVRACLPGAAGASLVSVRSVKEKRAAFAPMPGVEAMRPRAAGPSAVILAGDYTDTGWPATMEGAARSGYAAAAAALGVDPAELVVPSLRPGRLTRFLSRA